MLTHTTKTRAWIHASRVCAIWKRAFGARGGPKRQRHALDRSDSRGGVSSQLEGPNMKIGPDFPHRPTRPRARAGWAAGGRHRADRLRPRCLLRRVRQHTRGRREAARAGPREEQAAGLPGTGGGTAGGTGGGTAGGAGGGTAGGAGGGTAGGAGGGTAGGAGGGTAGGAGGGTAGGAGGGTAGGASGETAGGAGGGTAGGAGGGTAGGSGGGTAAVRSAAAPRTSITRVQATRARSTSSTSSTAALHQDPRRPVGDLLRRLRKSSADAGHGPLDDHRHLEREQPDHRDSSGASTTVTFPTAGSYGYYCNFHYASFSMYGAIEVQ